MKLYDEIIGKLMDMLAPFEKSEKPYTEDCWPTVSDRSMILRSDMAYELGSERLPGVGLTLVTGNEDFVSEDGVVVVGPELNEIKKDNVYARIALVRVDEDTIGEGNLLYKAIRDLEYTKYHFYPEGFMVRISTAKQKESVRIGKEALKNGLSFEKAGSLMIQAFKENPKVKNVKIIYITKEDFDYKTLTKLSLDSEDITKTIDHILKNVSMDCNVCNLQQVCDEIEGLREMHFANSNQNV